jgi:hypothetical protein
MFIRLKTPIHVLAAAAVPSAWIPVLWLALNGTIATTAGAQGTPKPAPAPPASVETTAAKSPWGRIVMIGASASAGFTESEPFGGTITAQLRLDRYVDAALLAPHEPVTNLASSLFFIQPEMAGRFQLEQALKFQPTLVVGADFLFWYCYGEGRSDAERLQRFEQGLKLLEAVQCPLILGDIPDASAAVNRMLRPDQIPSAAAMSAANRRLKAWAATRPRVAILSLSEFMRAVAANESLTIHGNTLPAGKTRVLLQDDKLHPSPPGCAVLALAILDACRSMRPAPAPAEVRWDPKEVFRLVSNPPASLPGNPAKPAVTNVSAPVSPTSPAMNRNR